MCKECLLLDWPNESLLNLVLICHIFIFFRCDGLKECTIPVRSSLFPDACPGTLKYLEIHYACRGQKSAVSRGQRPQIGRRPDEKLPPWLADKKSQWGSVHDNLIGDDHSSINSIQSAGPGGVRPVTSTTTTTPRKPILVTERKIETTTSTTTVTTTRRTSTISTTLTSSTFETTSKIGLRGPTKNSVRVAEGDVILTPKPRQPENDFEGSKYDLDRETNFKGKKLFRFFPFLT